MLYLEYVCEGALSQFLYYSILVLEPGKFLLDQTLVFHFE